MFSCLNLDIDTSCVWWSPFLVHVVMGGKRVLRLDKVDGSGEAWKNADVVSFDTGHWWSHQGSLQG